MPVLSARMDNGVDNLLRAVSVLRRKDFDIVDVSMKSDVRSNHSNLIIKISGNENTTEKAKFQLEKLFGLDEIRILEEM
ncbi:MAG: hypothetical protein N4A76_05255 [Firmicutes bacterium]|jgi:acetolactate synthase regulatory subunit|nr:hypothetical protein [Bacillota bacterium]